MGFKEILQSGEDQWYAFWDAADKKAPVHGMIDGIDKIFPSFYIFLILILALIGYVAFGAFSGGIGGGTTITLTVQDDSGNLLADTPVTVTLDGSTNAYTTNSVGKIILENVKIGSTMKVEIEKQNFQPFSNNYTAEANKEFVIQLLPPAVQERIIQLVDASGQSLSGKTITVQFSCENSSVIPDPQVLEASNGIVKAVPPKDCGTLIGKFLGTGFKTKDGVPLTGDSPIVEFEAVEPEKGTLQVKVLDKQGSIVQGMNVQIFDSQGGMQASKTTNAFGLSTFEDTPAGIYDATVSDPNNDYASATASVEVKANELNTNEITISKQVSGKIHLVVKDKSSQQVIAEAEVKLVDSSNGKIIEKQFASATGEVTFSAEGTGPFDVIALSTGYLSASQNTGIVSGNQEMVLQLEKLTSKNSGKIDATVLDETLLPVENAKVSIYDSKSGFLLNTVNPSTTDVNGTAHFVGVPAGTYFLRAYKFPNNPADSTPGTTKSEEVAQFSIKLAIGTSNLSVKALDKDGNPIPQAKVQFLSEGTSECGVNECVLQTGLDGIAQKAFKSDRKIYVIVSAAGYAPYSSASAQLYPNKTIEISANLEKTILGTSPSIELAGIFEKSGGIAKEMKAGGTYIAKFKLKFPQASVFTQGGAIIRTGIEQLMQNDALYFTSVNAPTAAILKATSFSPPLGQTIDQTNLTDGDFKWARIFYPNALEGVYNVEMELRVKDETVIGKKLAFNYNVFGIASDGKVKRAPLDAVLGEAATNPNRQEWYGEAFEKIYFEGTPELCDDLFCYSGEKVFDQAAQLLVAGPPYSVLINRNFDVSFLVSNNSTKIYPNAQIQVFTTTNGTTQSSNLLMTGYSIKTVDGELIEGKNLVATAIPDSPGQGIPVGRMDQFKTVQGKITVQPKQAGSVLLKVNLVNDGSIIFSKTIELAVISEQALTLTVDPAEAGAFAPLTFKVSAKDDQGAGVQGAVASLVKITPDKIKVKIDEKTTNSNGETTFNAPASSPNTRLVFDAVKEGFTAIPVTIIVDQNIVKFDPKTADFSLNAIAGDEQTQVITITNKTQNDLRIVKATVNITSSNGALEIGKMQNFVQQYENTVVIPANGKKDIDVKASLSNFLKLSKSTHFSGSIVFTFRSEDLGREWLQVLPVNVNIGVITNCDSGGVQLSGVGNNGKWETSVFESQVQEEFTISNTCEFENKPTALNNLKAKLTWTSDPLGSIEMTVTDIESGTSFTEALQHGKFVGFYDKFKTIGEGPYQAVITFIPLTGNIGKTAEFQVEIGAEPGASGKTISQTFSSKLFITNLNTCLTLDPQPEKGVKMKAGEDSAEFSIDSTKCGNVPIDIQFCNEPGNHNCSGGTPEGDIFLDQFEINNMTAEKKTITVERKSSTLAGNYGITVQARTPGTSFRQVNVMDVTIEPDTDHYAFALDKYEFLLPQKSAKDATTVTNSLFVENVAVTASVCDWKTASENNAAGKAIRSSLIGGATAGVVVTVAAHAIVTTGVGAAATGITWGAALFPYGTIAAVVAIIVILIIELTGPDPCDKKFTGPLQDYVINLVGVEGVIQPDAIDIFMGDRAQAFVKAGWDLKVSNSLSINNHAIQEVGAIFENTTGFTDPNPVYGVAEFKATEHRHNDPTHSGKAAVKCGNSNFGTFNIPCEATTVERTEKFHLKFKTQDTNYSLPNLNFDTVSCSDGTTLGTTGKGALPKIALNWSFNDPAGISINACDANNSSAVYCDATQFNIMLMKRIEKFQEFLQANNNKFSCPMNVASLIEDESLNQINSQLQTGSGEIGLKFISKKFITPTTIDLTVTVKNDTNNTQKAIVNVTISNPDESNNPIIPPSCHKEGQISKGGEISFDCIFDKLSLSEFYAADITLSSDSTANISQTNNAFFNFSTQAAADNTGNGTCTAPKTTAYLFNAPGINYWIDSGDPRFGKLVTAHPVFTADIPTVQALTDLLHFDALLEKDGYTTDFENDFRDFYTKQNFADTPTWFFNQTNGSLFSKYYGTDDHLVFGRKYTSENQLLTAGKYRIDLEIYFADDWSFFDANGEPKAVVGVIMHQLEEPIPNFAFYSLPFDGAVGSIGSSLDRVGYGTGFTNLDAPISIDNAAVKTFTSTNSSPLVEVQTDVANDLRRLNALPSTRGSLLTIEPSADGTGKKMIFSPSLATPVMMKVSHDVTKDPFSAIYTPLLDNVPVDTGNNFTFWDGAGNCFDFTGVPVYEKFNFSSDRAASPADGLINWENAYAVDWEKSLIKGDAYLRTIIYSPPQSKTALQSEKDYVKFITPADPTPLATVQLNGISTQPFNNFSSQIDSLKDIMDLVGQKQICLDNSGLKTRFFWNPQTIYNQVEQTSIHTQTQLLVSGKTCLTRAG